MRRTMPLAAPLALAGALLVAVPAHAAESLPVAAVTASDDDGNVPANTLEGDLATRWSAEGVGVWIRFDLGAAAPVGSVGLAWHKGDSRRSTFQVHASTDGNAWTTVVAQRQSGGGTVGLESYDFTDRTARYVRVVGYGNTDNDWTSVTEARIHGADGGGCAAPAAVLDLTTWKITLPTGASGSPTEVKQPALDSFQVAPWFTTADSCRAVQFRAPVNGVTTSGSSYPRSELREIADNGRG